MRIKVLISILAVLIGFIVIYNFYDNNRIVVREARVGIQDLPDSFEGFTILQISDLHQKEFGKDQKRLVEKINSLDYDLIAITGDMVNRVANVEPFYKMLEGIKNKKHVLFIEGNSDPMDYEFGDQIGFRKSDFIKGIEERGVFFLEFPYEIKRGNDS
ncbi:MAG: metallophosphoesterase, partial [Actinobacteria bacterium]|nr:metallophosphoesterase [Actinomycetota bacterium]